MRENDFGMTIISSHTSCIFPKPLFFTTADLKCECQAYANSSIFGKGKFAKLHQAQYTPFKIL